MCNEKRMAVRPSPKPARVPAVGARCKLERRIVDYFVTITGVVSRATRRKGWVEVTPDPEWRDGLLYEGIRGPIFVPQNEVILTS